jgi:hypothetical protein
MVHPDGTLYGQVTVEDVSEIIEKHLEKGEVVERLALMKLPHELASTLPLPLGNEYDNQGSQRELFG